MSKTFTAGRCARTALAAMAVGAVMAPSAIAGPAAGGSQIATTDPDPVSAVITQNRDTTGVQVSRVKVCFDQPVNNTADGPVDLDGAGPDVPGIEVGNFLAQGADAGNVRPSTNSRVIVGQPECVEVDFGALPVAGNALGGVDIQNFTTIETTFASAGDIAGRPNLPGSVSLGGTRHAPSSGNTTAPDLVGTPTVDTTNNTIDYTFDSPIVGANPASFGYVTTGGLVFVSGAGGSIVNNGFTYRAKFAIPLAAEPPKQFFTTLAGTINQQGDISGTGDAGVGTTSPDLVSVTDSGTNEWTLKYDRPVANGLGLGSFRATTQDGTTYPASSFGRPSADTITLSFSGLQSLAGSAEDKVVGISDLGGGMIDLEFSRFSSPAFVGTDAANIASGYTDGPDLRQVVLNSSNNTATFRFDDDVNPFTVLAGMFLVDQNGNLMAPTSPVVNSVTGNEVVWQFSGPILDSARGGTVFANVACDLEGKIAGTPNADCNPASTVGTGAAGPISGGGGGGGGGALTPVDPGGTLGPVSNAVDTVGNSGALPTGNSNQSSSTESTAQQVATVVQQSVSNPTTQRRRLELDDLSGRVARSRTNAGRFTVTGRIVLPSDYAWAAEGVCSADSTLVSIKGRAGGRSVGTKQVQVGSNCRYRATFQLTQRQLRNARSVRFSVSYLGNEWTEPLSGETIVARTKR